MSSPLQPSLPLSAAASVRIAKAELAQGNHSKAFEILAALVSAGTLDSEAFDAYRRLHTLVRGRDVPHAQVFDFIYAHDEWEGGSGPGSFPGSTAQYRAFLQDFMRKNKIRSVVDVGCGDWQSSRLIDWSGVDYLGIDVSAVVLKNTKAFTTPGVRFTEGDARTLPLPDADLLIIKDVLQHWSNADILAVLPKLRQFRYCLITNGATAHEPVDVNKDGRAGGFRPIDLAKAPFSVTGSAVLSYDVSYDTRRVGRQRVTVRTFLIERDQSLAAAPRKSAPQIPVAFAHEYDPHALHLAHPRGHNFQMYVAPRYREHYESNQYERFSASLVSTILRRSELFVDIGASYGFYSLLAATRHPNLDIVAIEPTPTTCAILRRNVALLGPSRVSVRELAVSDAVGHRQFNVAIASDSCGFFDHPNVGSLETIDVETTTVDALLKDRAPCPLVIKIDTEGNEVAVLRGMKETLDRFPDIKLIVEFCPGTLKAAGVQPRALLQYLEDLGFSVFMIDENRRKFYRARADRDNLASTRSDYANLYCVRRAQALNVCFFVHSSSLAGSERVLLELVDDLVVDHGAVCSVVMPSVGPLAAELAARGAAPIIVPYTWWAEPQLPTHTHQLEMAVGLKDSVSALTHIAAPDLRLLEPDVIWSQSMVIPWGALTAAAFTKPHVWYVTEFGVRDHGLQFVSSIRKTAHDIVASSDLVYTASEAVKQELFPDASSDHVRVLYCNVRAEDDALRSAGPASQFYKTTGAVRLGMFAAINPSKGQEDLVLATAELTRRGRSVELLLAGYELADFRRHLDQVVAQNDLGESVRFVGHLLKPHDAIRETDIVVVCSRNEAFGRTGVEAMLFGKPLVYPNIGGMLEYCIDGETGLSYAPGDIWSLVDRLERLIADPSQWEIMGNKGRARASALFTKETFSGEAHRSLVELRDRGRLVAHMPGMIGPALSSWARPAQGSAAPPKVGRNEPCPCGSGKKYKHCHGATGV